MQEGRLRCCADDVVLLRGYVRLAACSLVHRLQTGPVVVAVAVEGCWVFVNARGHQIVVRRSTTIKQRSKFNKYIHYIKYKFIQVILAGC